MAHKAKDVRRTIEYLLRDELGEYTLANGVATPAIAVRAESERLPTGTKASGLEVVVIRYPEETPVRQYLLEPLDDFWTIWLVGWDNTADLTLATQLLLTAFPGTEFPADQCSEVLGADKSNQGDAAQSLGCVT